LYPFNSYTIPELVKKSSEAYADRRALSMTDGGTVLYRDIEPRTKRIAALLHLMGVKKGDKVAILSENRPEWGLAYFGISTAGGIAVPIMTAFTNEQITAILDHSESIVLIVSKRFVSKAPIANERIRILSVEDLRILSALDNTEQSTSLPGISYTDLSQATENFVSPEIKSDDIASILYTSGTMGNSKGVMLNHRNLISNAEGARKFIVLTPDDRVLSILPIAHAYEFTIGFLIPMMQGSAIYYLDKPPSASALLPAFARIRPTVMLSVPLVIEKIYRSSVKPALEKMVLYRVPVLRRILELLAGLKLKRTFGGSLRFFGIGGAPLAPDVERFLHNARFPYSIGYGLTETAPLLAGNKPMHMKLHTTGIATSDVELRIADRRDDTGEGEIQARGPNIFPGYFKDPERTAETFTSDGWFRTGDLGAVDKKGTITVRGRLKTMILSASGENVYPEEIESVLNSSPYVAESLVYGDDKGLIALVHLKQEELERFASRIKDDIGDAVKNAEQYAAKLLEDIRRETNARLAAFSRITRIEQQKEPFEKTPKQSIKRFLYPKK
jgi:long-chain acyl-CoA synthetase